MPLSRVVKHWGERVVVKERENRASIQIPGTNEDTSETALRWSSGRNASGAHPCSKEKRSNIP